MSLPQMSLMEAGSSFGAGDERFDVLAANPYGTLLRTPHGIARGYRKAELRHLIALLSRSKRKGPVS